MKVLCTLCDRCGKELEDEPAVRSPIGVIVGRGFAFSRRHWELCQGCEGSLRTWAAGANPPRPEAPRGPPALAEVTFGPGRLGSRISVPPATGPAPTVFRSATWDTRSFAVTSIALRVVPGPPLRPKEG